MASAVYVAKCTPFSAPSPFFHGAELRSSALRSNLAGSHKPSMTPREVEKIRTHFQPHEALAQVAHSMLPEKVEIFKSLEKWAEKNILIHLKPVDQSWQPQDFLPDPSSEGFVEQLIELRKRSHELPDDYLVCLVGDMITEKALPTYQTMLNTFDGVRDETGASPTSWAIWTRMWTAEENRHGDLLHKYLYLSGRVDMRQIEKTIQYLIGFGMVQCLNIADILSKYIIMFSMGGNKMWDSILFVYRAGHIARIENSPYLGFLYTSFQERATFISHANTARLAKGYGDLKLAQICGTIAADEKRHETAYTKIVEKLFEIDPNTTMLAFEDLMKKKVVMPAHLMYDGQDSNLFHHFSSVARRLGVYTAGDYADILEFLVERWNVKKIGGLSGKGMEAQDYVCKLASRIRKLNERAQEREKQGQSYGFSWIFNKQVLL
eukprot:PITA_04167